MGIINRGILGGFQNKTGAVVGVRWRGLDVMRGMPRRVTKLSSQAQLDHQKKFKLLSQLLTKVASVIEVGFKDPYARPTALNRAMGDNLKHALIGVAPNFHLDYSKLSFSRGSRALPKEAAVHGMPQAQLSFNWSYAGDQDKNENAFDLVTVLVYNPANDVVIKQIRTVTRSDQGFILQLSLGFSGDTVHAYLIIESAYSLGSVSNTLYLGAILVLP
ncbi:hypothetical protein IWX76_000111 [Pedobacter sp. CAN_A7]|uniref:DUF6266 family protein n=1 Tax=Pedobacter sp. CAN_A7 TaxID=2787722 RepID=UPI0018C9DB1D